MGRPLSGASAPKGTRPVIARFGGETPRQFKPVETPVVESAPQKIESEAPVQQAVAVAAPTAEETNDAKMMEAQRAKNKEAADKKKIEADIKAYALKKAQKALAAKKKQ